MQVLHRAVALFEFLHTPPPLLWYPCCSYIRRVFAWLKCCCFIICTLCPAAAATAAAQSYAIMWVRFTPTRMQPTAPAYTSLYLYPPLPTPLLFHHCAVLLVALSPSSSSSSSWPCCSCTNCLNYAKYARHQTKSTIHPPSPPAPAPSLCLLPPAVHNHLAHAKRRQCVAERERGTERQAEGENYGATCQKRKGCEGQEAVEEEEWCPGHELSEANMLPSIGHA